MTDARSASRSILSARDVHIAIGARVLAENLDIDVHTGELWCVLGPNGSGKSTLLQTLAGLRAPRGGRIDFDGRPWQAWTLRDGARRRGLLPQHQSYPFSATVMECVLLGRHPHIGRFARPSEHDYACAAAALDAMDLTGLADRDVLALSGGERQRVALAALLAQDPGLFLLDEPTAHLDLAHQVALLRRLCALTTEAGRAVVLATHDFNLAARFATHALLLYGDGRFLAGGAGEILQAETLSAVFNFALVQNASAQAPVFVPRW
ncbi:MAG: ABC transporter ATP-binding protein [Betaproteobacteria bacterium]|nr:MAG: ABC transporter ATP-binding protein [Betaproteobacteria bacterium]